MKERGKIVTIILLVIIFILVAILGYGVYTGIKVKAEISSLQSQVQQLTKERDELQRKYGLLQDDVFDMKKSCLKQNACLNHFPGVRWYCNNVGDEVDNPSNICVCDENCNLSVGPMS
jgi:hypothetical protein